MSSSQVHQLRHEKQFGKDLAPVLDAAFNFGLTISAKPEGNFPIISKLNLYCWPKLSIDGFRDIDFTNLIWSVS